MKDFVSAITIRDIPIPDLSTSRSDYIFYKVTYTLDHYLVPEVNKPPYAKDPMPLAIVIDIEPTILVDLSGLNVLKEISSEAREKNVKVVIINVKPHLVSYFSKFGLENDVSNKYVDLDSYLSKSLLPTRTKNEKRPKNPFENVKYVKVESTKDIKENSGNEETKNIDEENKGEQDAVTHY